MQQQQSGGRQSQSMGRRGCFAAGLGGALLIAVVTSLATGLGTGVGRALAERVVTWVECLFQDCDPDTQSPEFRL
ncbi:MAG: hypothetical protein ACFB6R_11890 [Alphaproteobacteria bacterium]